MEFYTAGGNEKKRSKMRTCHYLGEEQRPKDVAWRGESAGTQGRTKQVTRMESGTTVRFYLLSASQENTRSQKNKRIKKKYTCMAEAWRLKDGAFLLSVYISAMLSFEDPRVIWRSAD